MSAKSITAAISSTFLLFGTTVYVGVLWALHFFWYPSWEVMNVTNVQDHFINPTSAATDFFWIVVPIMFVTNVIMIVLEWKTKHRWTFFVALAGISGASYIGQALIIPVNDTIAQGITDQARLTEYLTDWMKYNDWRWMTMNVMWLALVYYYIAKGGLMSKPSLPTYVRHGARKELE